MKDQKAKVNYILGAIVTSLVSGSDLLEWLRATHSLDTRSAIVVSGCDLLEQQRATHELDGHSAIVVSGSDMLEWRRATHILDVR